ncbi:hypothetical protein [Baaleninema sp.]|uniref:hypothetical protein n=1 Tax=Baaleninema sp. TaxID=3101197 RepID=UPI003D0262F1
MSLVKIHEIKIPEIQESLGYFWKAMFQTEFEFTLPKGYVDSDGNLHRKGIMRLANAIDEILPMRDPRVKSNPAYATVIILARTIERLGALDEVSPTVIENLYACDLNYLQKFYRKINEIEDEENSRSSQKPK